MLKLLFHEWTSHSAVGDALSQAESSTDQSLLQFIDVIHFRLVDSVLYFSENFGQSYLDCCGSILIKKLNADVSYFKKLIVSNAPCAVD